MRFVIHQAALNDDDEDSHISIDRLVDRLADEVHHIDLLDPDLLEGSCWYESARATRKKVLTTSLAKPPRVASNRGPHVKKVEVFDSQSAKLADRIAYTPLTILVEDRESDGSFLDVIVEELAWPELSTLWSSGRTATPCAMEIATAGGKDSIPQRVERGVSDAAEQLRPYRLFVLCDSDARWPGDIGQTSYRTLERVRDICAKYGIPLHVWTNRSTENYIPDEVFEAVRAEPNRSRYVDRYNALLRRSPVQRDHFPLKDGLSADERREAMKAGLYAPSEEEDLKLLEQPLFPRSPRPILRLCRELRGSFTADGLRERDGEGELDDLLHALAQEL